MSEEVELMLTSEVRNLEDELHRERAAHLATQQELSAALARLVELSHENGTARTRATELEFDAQELAQEVERLTKERDEWRRACDVHRARRLETERERDDARAALDRLHEFSYFTLESMRLATADVKLVAMIRSFKSQLADLKGKKS